MGYFNSIGGVASPLKQKEPQGKGTYNNTEEDFKNRNTYYYKNNGKKITQYEYCKLQGKINQDTGQGGEGLQTDDPDPCGKKAKTEKARSKLPKKATVLTESQTKAIEKKVPFKK
tara:strand:- start:9 stop:353 length:345 start_codon:yes stop_codon:yes gene_type:complete